MLVPRALDEPPGEVELGLRGDMVLRELLLVLQPEDLGDVSVGSTPLGH